MVADSRGEAMKHETLDCKPVLSFTVAVFTLHELWGSLAERSKRLTWIFLKLPLGRSFS